MKKIGYLLGQKPQMFGKKQNKAYPRNLLRIEKRDRSNQDKMKKGSEEKKK